MSTAAIRSARPDEADAIAALVAEAYRHYIPRIGRPPAPMTADYAAIIASGHAYIVPGGAGPDGLLVAYRQDDALFIENVAVAPRTQGRGLGRQLLDFAANLARREQLKALTLYTNALMAENVLYYGKLGFIETARKQEASFDRVYMRKDLA